MAENREGTPRWVKVFGAVIVVVVVVFVVVSLLGGREHGPGRHAPANGSDTAADTSGGHAGAPPGITHTEP